jgi:hypothetical protein
MRPLAILAAAIIVQQAACTPLDDYVSKNDSHFAWFDTGARISTVFGGCVCAYLPRPASSVHADPVTGMLHEIMLVIVPTGL